jgi:hypothetical protein
LLFVIFLILHVFTLVWSIDPLVFLFHCSCSCYWW